ncbi:zinc ribbon domain-containing protein [Leucobacter sp. HY1910]
MDVWEQFRQKRLLSKVPRSWATSAKHLLSGLMSCGGCGGSLLAMSREYRVRDPETKKVVEDMSQPKYVHYGCVKGYGTGIRGEFADEYVGAVVVQQIYDPRIRQAFVEVPDTGLVEEELLEPQQRAEQLREMHMDGALTRAALNERIAPVPAQVERLQRRLSAMRADSPVADLALADSIQERWEQLTVLQKSRVITELGLTITILRDQRGKAPLVPDGKALLPEERTWARIVVERP